VEKLGPLMALAVNNDEANCEKIRAAWAELQQREPQRDISTLRALLEAEVASGIHKPGGVLADPSAAVALRWLRRSLGFFATILARMLDDRTASIPQIARSAYKEQLESLHGWVVRKTMCAGFSAMPCREEVLLRLSNLTSASQPSTAPPSSCGGGGGGGCDGEAELQGLVDALQEALGQMRALFIELDLEESVDKLPAS